MNRIFHRGTVLLAWMAMLLLPVHAAEKSRREKPDSVKPTVIVESPGAAAGVRYESQDRRDPFLNPIVPKKGGVRTGDEEESRGPRVPGIGGMFIDQVALLGVAAQDGDQTAIFRGTDSRAYFLHEGDRFYDGSVTRIGADTVTIVRETKYRSGKVLRQEVTKRLRPQ